MKRYNRANLRWVICGILLPILIFFSASGVLAYFTATATAREASTTTGLVKLIFRNDVNSTSVISNSSGSTKQSRVYSSRAVTHSQKLLPGDTVSSVGSLTNDGNVSIYTILQYEVYVDNGTEELKHVAFYILNTNDNTSAGNNVVADSSTVTPISFNTYTMLTSEPADWSTSYANYYKYVNGEYIANDSSTYSAGTYYVREFNAANQIASNSSKKFKVSFTFDGATYDNTYKNASVTTVVTGYAIQTANISSAREATRLLVKRAYDIYSPANKTILLSSTGATASYLA